MTKGHGDRAQAAWWEGQCEQLVRQNEQLRAQVAAATRAVKAANSYYGCYVQDAADDIECCISPEQHEAAKELRDALREIVPTLTSPGEPA